jgi:hypothetical protein
MTSGGRDGDGRLLVCVSLLIPRNGEADEPEAVNPGFQSVPGRPLNEPGAASTAPSASRDLGGPI